MVIYEKYLAHRNKANQEDEIKDHSARVADLAGKFASKFEAEDFGRRCGKAHDIGKYSSEFQGRIRGDNRPVDHSTFGAKELSEKYGDFYSGFCVAGHHTGLPDLGVPEDDPKQVTFCGRLKRDLPDASAYQKEITIDRMVPGWDERFSKMNDFERAFFIRMLFSCLVDADYLDTEAFMKGPNKAREAYPSLISLQEKLLTHIKREQFDDVTAKEKIKRIRAEILVACQAQAKAAPGLFTLTAPTGSGKTISSLAFALAHALEHGKDRVIYVVPYCTIIDQTVAVFEKILGKEAVLAHHSGSDYDITDEGQEVFDFKYGNTKQFAAENWNMPVIVTTSVQFFESLYGSKPSKCRKIHNIANSVVIFDEGQALPVPYLKPCMEAIEQLVKHYHTTALFMSATQPVFENLLFEQEGKPMKRTDIIQDATRLASDLSRNTFSDLGEIELESLAEKIARHSQVLCIVNTRKNGADLLKKIGETDQTYLLTTLLMSGDRQRLLTEIKNKLKNGEPCQVISTSLIEAGVDIDFPVVYREVTGLDSILQAAGRCNRENKKAKENSWIYCFLIPEFQSEKILSKNISAMKTTLHRNPDIEDPQTTKNYFSKLYQYGDLDQEGIIGKFKEGVNGSWYPFRTVSQKFHLIEDNDATVYIANDENQALILAVQEGRGTRQTFRRLGKYAASVPLGVAKELLENAALKSIGENSYVLKEADLYHKKYGLQIYE